MHYSSQKDIICFHVAMHWHISSTYRWHALLFEKRHYLPPCSNALAHIDDNPWIWNTSMTCTILTQMNELCHTYTRRMDRRHMTHMTHMTPVDVCTYTWHTHMTHTPDAHDAHDTHDTHRTHNTHMTHMTCHTCYRHMDISELHQLVFVSCDTRIWISESCNTYCVRRVVWSGYHQ